MAAIVGIGWVQSRNTISLGDPNGGRMGAVTVNPVSTHLAAFACRPQESGGHGYGIRRARSGLQGQARAESEGARSQRHPHPQPQRQADAAIGSRRAAGQVARLAEGSAEPALQHRGHARELRRTIALAGGGGVGVGNNSPFGNQFGAYADLLRNRVAQYWKTTRSIRGCARRRRWA